MSSPTQCIDCEQRIGGIIDWCTLLRQDVTQSCYEHNTPADCPKRDENKKGGTEVSNQNKPRICEVLGFEVGEEFEVRTRSEGPFHISESGKFTAASGYSDIIILTDIINHPEKIIRKERFSLDDIELMRHIRAVFGAGGVWRSDNGKLWFSDGNYDFQLPTNMLLSINRGDKMVELRQVLKEEDQCH